MIAIIGVMMSMMIPAIQASRETARRNLCQSNLAQLLLAMQNYENAFESFPAGVVNPDGPIRCEPSGLHQGWLLQMLPYLEEGNAYRLVDFSKSVYDPANAAVRDHWPNVIICPSEPYDIRSAANYAGCHHEVEAPIAADNHGVLFLNSYVRRDDVSDGVSHTLFVGEKHADPDDLGWMSGTRATLRNTGLVPNDPSGAGVRMAAVSSENVAPPEGPAVTATYVGGFGSAHSGGLSIALGDASVRFIADEIDQKVWQQLGHRSDGKLLNLRLSD